MLPTAPPMQKATALSHCLLWILACAWGCDGGQGSSEPPPSRVVAVSAQRNDERDVADFCEVHGRGDRARPFVAPPLREGSLPTPAGFRWVNIWATWCRPCVEELPMLVEWQSTLRAEGKAFSLALISADADAAAVEGFRVEHGNVPPSHLLSEPSALATWSQSVGLDEGATLPIHVLVDGGGKIRCLRTGSVQPSHLEVVRTLLEL